MPERWLFISVELFLMVSVVVKTGEMPRTIGRQTEIRQHRCQLSTVRARRVGRALRFGSVAP